MTEKELLRPNVAQRILLLFYHNCIPAKPLTTEALRCEHLCLVHALASGRFKVPGKIRQAYHSTWGAEATLLLEDRCYYECSTADNLHFFTGFTFEQSGLRPRLVVNFPFSCLPRTMITEVGV